MSWPQWPVGGASTLPGVINPAPTVASPVQPVLNPVVQTAVPPQYTPEQWTQMQHQNWQQWAQWQQQYQQWHQQYGAEYQKALNAQGVGSVQPPLPVPQVPANLPNTSLPPPPPAEPKPPLPLEDPPHGPPANNQGGNYSHQPPPKKFERNLSSGRNSSWQNAGDNRNRRYSNQGPPQDHGFGKRNSNFPGGSDQKRSRPDDNWQKMNETPPNKWNSSPHKPPPKVTSAEELSEAEKKFDKQFAEWEAQFNKWKEQNANHPDKTQYREYEKKWETWRAQLLERREQMRRKRLNLASASPKLPQIEKKQPLLSTPLALPEAQIASFNRPPPTVNNDPLEFTKKMVPGFDDSESNLTEAPEKKEFDTSFLTSANAGGIPGLDLVKEDEKGEKPDSDIIDADNTKSPVLENTSKPQDLEALSKGINNILGDQKLLSMLSLVSQNQNLNFNTSTVNTAAQVHLEKNDYSNQSMDDNSNPGGNCSFNKPNEGFNTFDDQTRSSFTAGVNDQDIRFEPPRPDDSAHRTDFRRPPDFQNFRPNDSNFREQGPSGFRDSGGSRGGNDFREPPGYSEFQDDNRRGGGDFDSHFRGPNNMEAPTDFEGAHNFNKKNEIWGDNYNRRPNDFNRGGPNESNRGGPNSFIRGGPSNFNRGGSGDFHRAPNDFNRGGAVNDFNRGGPSDLNRGGPSDLNRGGAPNEFNRVGPNDFNRGGASNEFNRGPNDFNRGGSSDFNRGASPNDISTGGPNGFNRGGFNDFIRGGPNDFNRGGAPNNVNRGGTKVFNKGSDDFNRGGPSDFNRGGASTDFNRGGPNDFNRGAPGDFNREGPNDFNREGPNFERFTEENNVNKPDRWGGDGGPGVFNRNDRFERNNQNNFGPNMRDNFRGNGPNRYGISGDNFRDGSSGPNSGFDNFREGPKYIENIRNNQNYQSTDNRGPPGPPASFNQGPSREDENFSRDDIFNRGRSENFGAQPNEPWGGERDELPNRTNDYFSRGPLPDNKNDRFSRLHHDRQFNFKPSESYDEHSSQLQIEPPVNPLASELANKPAVVPDILKPETVVEYDHKPLKPAEPEVIVEPIQTFDYRHKPVNRIPLPQRPQWLMEILRSIREFEPLLNIRSFEHSRRYSDWMYDDRKKYDSYYDERRRFDDYNEPRSETRYNYEDRRSYEERRSYERSRSREHDDFSEDSRYGYKNYRKGEETRRCEDVPSGRTHKYEEPLHSDKYEEKERKVESKVIEEPVHKPVSAPVDMTTAGNGKVTLIEDILSPPGRFSRPARIVIILRGPPGSGKTTLAKLIKDKEVESGGSAPRILSLDDYFMVEHEKEIIEDGRKVKIKEMKYEYEECMEATYRISLMKAFKKTITDGYFNFIIVDNVNDKVKYFGEMWSFAKQSGFQVYICQLELDVQACTKRNVHGRTEGEIERCVAGWEPTPSHHPMVDVTSLIQAQSIPEVEMEEINSPPSMEEGGDEEHAYTSKWDTFDCSVDNLAKLDGTSKPLKPTRTMEDYLQLDEWEPKSESKPGQKRVRWADLEERKKQEKMRAIGFVVGQTNWDRMMDPTMGGSALTQTKYIERVGKY